MSGASENFLFELLVVALEPPAQLGEIDQAFEGDILQQGCEPILGRLFLVGGPFDHQSFFDLEHIDRWSIWLDLVIIIKTFWKVLKAEGAY